MVIYFHEDLRARSRLDWLGRTRWRFESARMTKDGRYWDKHEYMTAREFESVLAKPPSDQEERDFRRTPQNVGLCLA